MKMDSIIAHRFGYTNKMMYEHCLVLYNVLNQSIEVKEGRGKSIVTRKKFKYAHSDSDRALIEDSLKYYKYKMENEKVEFRNYQKQIINSGSEILKQFGFVYLAMEVRTGKTLTSLGIAQELGCKNVLFVTKKKAIGSIQSDYNMLNPSFSITIINYESLHTINDFTFNMIVCDEAHSMGAFPKPSERAKLVKEFILKNKNPYVVLLSGTPTPESYSQMYHQVYGIKNNPFKQYKNFYRFCDDYVAVKERMINSLMIKDYSGGSKKILDVMQPYMISYTQKDAGFKVETREHIIYVKMSEMTYSLTSKLKRDLVIQGKGDVILADTPVKLMMKLHQLYSGTIKFESGNSMIMDLSKAKAIYDNFCVAKIGIFYKFKEELNALMQVFGPENLTTDLGVFEDTDKSIALQIVSGREGISLKKAEALVYYNIDFSATSYWQSKDRMTTKDRLENDVYWVFAEGGIEDSIYKAVLDKKDYTVNHFKKDLLNS
jgi:hypothetical protein